jgi:uncharacterized protein (DUF2384 family)
MTKMNRFPIQEAVVYSNKTTEDAFTIEENQSLPTLKVIELDDSSATSLCGSFASALDHFHMSFTSNANAQCSVASISRASVTLHRRRTTYRKRIRCQRNKAMTSLDFERLVFSQLDLTL